MTNPSAEALHKPGEAAALLRVSKRTVRRLYTSGELRSVRVGRAVRIPDSALRDLLDAPTSTPERTTR